MKLSKEQLALLVAVHNGEYRSTEEKDISADISEDLAFFLESKLITPIYRAYTKEELDYYRHQRIMVVGSGAIKGYKISARGKGTLWWWIMDNRRFWIGFWVNLALSVIAIIISIIALVK